MNGKRGKAPCGHEGEHLTTNYVQCLRCDVPRLTPAPYDADDWFLESPTQPGLTMTGAPCSKGAFHDYQLDGFSLSGNATWSCVDCGHVHIP